MKYKLEDDPYCSGVFTSKQLVLCFVLLYKHMECQSGCCEVTTKTAFGNIYRHDSV